MTSKKVVIGAVVVVMTGCNVLEHAGWQHDVLTSPYPQRRLLAVAVLSNESGSSAADGVALADHLVHQLETAPNVDVLPLNRTIAHMEAMGLNRVSSPADALALMRAMGADGLVAGSITAFDPYDPPRIGMVIELYTLEAADALQRVDPRQMSRQGTGGTQESPGKVGRQPVGVISGVYSAADPRVRQRMQRYALQRGPTKDLDAWHRYRISIDLYSEFIAYVMSERLMEAEAARLVRDAADRPTES